ncbi:uncharacterized protein EDB91DRAFT_1057653, partial [Suillus paluster]|uniref:uncharacterized protein n=1 Tax=Suillus paluster TaxID=48578 RepID=UPI001B86BA18
YAVPRSNHLWHLDGHHKLILWGIVIDGLIDGYCRTESYFFNNLINSLISNLDCSSSSK